MSSPAYYSGSGTTAVVPHSINISTAEITSSQAPSSYMEPPSSDQKHEASLQPPTASPFVGTSSAINSKSVTGVAAAMTAVPSSHYGGSHSTHAAATAGGSGRARWHNASFAAALRNSSGEIKVDDYAPMQAHQEASPPSILSHSTDADDDDDDDASHAVVNKPIEYCGVRLLPGVEQIDFDEGYYVGTIDENGEMAGYGKATWHSGDTYEGEWLNGLMHGKGTYTWADGDYYHGDYVRGRMEGSGEMKDATGLYTGEWVDDMRQGYGRMLYAGGNVYEGEWLAGMRHGSGKLVEPASRVTYEGEFNRNEKEGRGVQTNADGDVYEGEFVRGKPNGRGTYLWADGARYTGMFKDGVKHGDGCEWLANGDWVAGLFVDGEHVDSQSTLHKATILTHDSSDPDDGSDTGAGEGGARGSTGNMSLSESTAAAVLAPLDAEKLRRITDQAQTPSFSVNVLASAMKSLKSSLLKDSSSLHHDFSGLGGMTAEDVSSPLLRTLAIPQMLLDDSDLEGWTPLKTIGKGSFGAVYTALLRNGRTVCCKVIELGNVESEEEMEKLRNEIALMRRLRHPNCVQYYGSLEDKVKNTLNIFMEYVSGGTLTSFVTKFKSIPLETLRQWVYQMVCGVKYLHECGIVHRDIKGDNVLVSVDGIVKLADFGCSKAIDGVCSATHGCSTMVGTPYWMAPEVIKCEAGGYGVKSDIWSIGCTIVEMLTGKPPWPECNSMWAAVYKIANSTGLPTEIPPDIDPELMDLLQRCFERNPKLRPTAADMLNHLFLAKVTEGVTSPLEESRRN
ncbi:protein kinase, putative [Leishmania tarentolae]|uniref:Protein kinase, putative n=1 Tax=Leishmania tarentolae TaxID=5689 RepID=A0A640K881_LEITA|nr:protein kinase, putative [Leishmania tarentolae]